MITPHNLAAAAAWSLHQARGTLAQIAADEAALIAAEATDPRDGLRSPVWGSRHATGHGDPVGTLVLALGLTGRVNRAALLADDITRRLSLPARHFPGPGDPLDRLTAGIPTLSPHAAARLGELFGRLDARIRRDLRLPSPWQHLTGRECPACRGRLLYELTCAPGERPVRCEATACLCTGPGCRCGQDGAVEGVQHIWPRADVIGAVAGATPTQTN